MKRYYITIDGNIEGPYSTSEIHDMVNDGVVTPNHMCWTSGMFDWHKISACLPGLNTSMPLTKMVQAAQLFSEKSIRQHFFIYTLLWCVTFPLHILNLKFIVVDLLMIIAFGFVTLFVYRHWLLLQGYGARVTPGKAVFFLFVPIFNLYWFFVAFVGLAEDNNIYMSEFMIRKHRMSYNLALSYYVAAVMSFFLTTYVFIAYSDIVSDTMYLANTRNNMIYNLSKLIDFAIMILGYFFAYQQREAILSIIKQKKAKLKRDNLRDILTK